MYESFYKLSAKPFRLSPDSGFFFPSRGHKRALAYLRYGLSQGEGFVVITGAPGTGKTTLAQILLKEMDQRHLVVAHLTTTQLEADEMLRMVAASFGLRYEGMDKAALLKTLEAFLMARSREKKRALLVVDEAQNLPARSLEELRMLSNLQVGDRALLQTFLLGQPQFRQMLEHPDLEQLRQRVIANYHLSPLATDECKSYVESRLNQVGWQNDPSFTPQAYETIYEFSEGIPRRINMLCDRVLLFSFLEELHEVNNAVLRQVTDELGQEISGRPLPAVAPAESLLHQESGSLEDKTEVSEDIVAAEAGESNEAEETPVAHDNSEKLDAALQEQEEAKDDANKTDPPSDVFELASAEPSLRDVEAPSVSDDGSLDRVMPDDGWTQPQALVDTAEESEDESTKVAAKRESPDLPGRPLEDTPKPNQADRFRVIPGGRKPDEKAREPLVLAPLPDAPGDTEEVTTRKILRLVLAFHRSPRSFPGLDDPTQPLPRGVRNILQLAIAEDEVLSSMRQISVMGISPAMLRAAVRFFVRRVMFVPGGDDYRVLGLRQEASLAEIEVNYGLLMRLLRHDNAEVVDGGVSRVGSAYEHLCQGIKGQVTPAEDDVPALNESEVINTAGGLDLDVAPKVEDAVKTPSQHIPVQEEPYVEVDEGDSGALFRNVILVAGLVVVLLVLYVTQVRGLKGEHGKAAEEMQTIPALAPAPAREVVPESSVSLVTPKVTNPDDEAGSEPVSLPKVEIQTSVINRAPDDVVGEASANSPLLDARSGVTDSTEEAHAIEIDTLADAEAETSAAYAEAEALVREKAAEEARIKAETEEKLRIAAQRKAEEEKVRAKAKADAAARATAQEKLDTEKKTVVVQTAPNVTPSTTSSVDKKMSPTDVSPTEADLSQVLNRFSTYYEQGDVEGIMSLFSPKARTDTQTTSKGIRAEFVDTFASSDKRNMGFMDLSWKRENAFARGRGKFQTTILPKDASTPVLTSGSVTIQITKSKAGLKISRLYYSDVKVIDGSLPVSLGEDDLNPLMTAFVTYYEAGDINGFMDLFSRDASSNDRSTPAGIRRDYEGLFESTFERRMALQNLKWMIDGDIARGEANYRVSVRPEKNVDTVTYNGTLWVQVELRKGLARITHFAFVE